MKDELKELHTAMEQTVFKKEKFTVQQKKAVWNKINKKKKRQDWFPRALSVAFAILFLGLAGYLVNSELETSIQSGSESLVQVDLSEIEEPVRIPEDLHQRIAFLNINDHPEISAWQNETSHRVDFSYQIPESSMHLVVSQYYSESGNEEVVNLLNEPFSTTKEVEKDDKKIILLENGSRTAGYFTDDHYLFTVTHSTAPVPPEVIQEILETIDIK